MRQLMVFYFHTFFRFSIRAPIPVRRASTRVRAVMDSTTTTALGTMTGSWRPLIRIWMSSPSWLTVFCGEEMEGVGLI